jgi:thiol-disulfide isomerase/thioredoxin
MNKKIGIIIGVVVILLGAYVVIHRKDGEMLSTKQMQQKVVAMAPSVDKENNSMMKAGSYEPYSPDKVLLASATHDVVLFFRAGWCPTCRAVDADIKNNLSKIPSDLTILDVNYDNSTALKQMYAVTYQHTFVQVDKDGKLIKKWSGSPTLATLVAEVK